MKKITLLFAALMFWLGGFGQISEGFEGSTLPDLSADTWALGSGTWGVFDNGVGVNQSWTVNSTIQTPPFVYEGTNAAYVNRENIGQGNTSQDYLATPLVTIPANGQLRFFTRTTLNGNQGTIYKIMTAPSSAAQNAPAAYTELTQWTETTLTATFNLYEEKVVDLSAFAGQQIYVAFVREFTQPLGILDGDRWLVDRMRIVSACADPTALTAGNITQTSAQLSWGNPGGATQWEIEIIPFAATPTGTGTLITSNPYTATTTLPAGVAFAPTTQYKYYIRSVCGTGPDAVPSAWVGPQAFSTSSPGLNCSSPIVVPSTPYTTTDSTANYQDTTDTAQPASCAGTATNYMTGNDVFYSYTPSADGAISITMTPAGTFSGIFVYDGCANVGVTCVAGVANSGTTPRSIPSLAVTAGHQYIIVISTNATPQTVGYTLDIQTLNCAPPTGLSAAGNGPNEALLSWNAGAATSWEVFVQTPGSPLPTTAGTTANTNTNFSVTTLNNGTPIVVGCYQYWVRAACGDGTFSPWTGPYQFCTLNCTTSCTYNFVMTDSFGDGWNGNTMTITQGASTTTIGSTFTTGTGPITVPVALCQEPFTLTWNTGGAFANEVGISIVNSFGQTIYTHAPGTNQQGQVLYSGNVDCANPLCLPPTALASASVTTNGATLSWTPNGPAPLSWDVYAVPTGSPVPDATTTPTANTTNNPFTISGLLADTSYVFYVRAVCAGAGENPWSVASAPFTTLPTCPKPTALAASAIDMGQATFSWTPGGTETTWEVIALPDGSPAPTASTTGWTPAPTNPFTLGGLSSGTAYDFYVRGVCSSTDSSTWAGPLSFNTSICPAANQCLYTFTLTDSFGDGWNGNTMNVTQNGIVVAELGSTFTTGTGPLTVQVPLCNGVPFELVWNTGGNFANEVGVSITSFLGEVLYTHAPGTNQQGTTLYQGTGECIAPTCLKPTGVVVSNISLDSATVTWTDNNTPAATSWDVLVLPSTAPAPTPTATGWTNVGTNPYTLTNLSPASCYKVYVRSVCSDTDSSFWSLGGQFCTVICLPSNLCEYTFVMVDSFGDGWNGNTMSVTQNGVLVATLTGPTNTDNQAPVSQIVPLCNNVPFELFWNAGGTFANEVGISIVNSTGTTLYTHAPGTGAQNTELFSATVSCVPPTCPKPVQLAATNVTETTAVLNWMEASTATAWEIVVLPAGSPAPTASTAGTSAASPYTATGLDSGTSYVFYVRAICSDTDMSLWAGPLAFTTLITNDECATATIVPVNPDQSCGQTSGGTLIGATASGTASTCGGTPDDDVWFSFVATGPSHTIDLTNITGSTTDLYHVLYAGTCGALTQVYCSDNNQSVASNLVAGQTYFIRVYSWTGTPGQTSTFTVCVGTIPPSITSNNTTYTPEQLVQDVLINSTCALVNNITYSTGTNFGSSNGIAYFEKNGSGFPFENGVVLTTGDALAAPGPNTSTLGAGTNAWVGDPDLQAIVAAGGNTELVRNATVLEFDFVPVIDDLTFNFLFASEEYGTFQCSYSDVFAFLLTNTVTGVTTNLAVLPNTTTPVSVVTIRDQLYNNGCTSVNPQYFGTYYGLPAGQSPLAAPINFNGTTVPLTASATVVPGTLYHIKLAIADYNDTNFDSAVFLEGGSFGIGDINLGDNLLESTGNAVCNGGNATIATTLDPSLYNFAWFQDGQPIPNETGPSLTVTEEGTYTIQVNFIGTTCIGTDDVIVEFYEPVAPGAPSDLYVCNATGTGVFDLTSNQAAMLAPLGTNYSVTYYLTLADATAETNAITNPLAYTNIMNPQTIYVRVENNVSGCYGIVDFDLIVQDLTPQFTLPADFAFCDNTPQTIAVTPVNFTLDQATYSWTLDGNALPDTGSSIVITVPGFYEVTVDRGCTATMGVTATSNVTPVIVSPGNQTVCDSYMLPMLAVGSYYSDSQANGGVLVDATQPVMTTQTLWIYAASGMCSDEESFTVTVNMAQADDIADVVECTNFTLPALSANNTYWTQPGGTGTQLNVGDVITTSQIIYVYAQSGTIPNCTDEESFTVTLGAITADVLPDVSVCDNYTLPALSANNTYWTLPGGTGTQLNAGDMIITSQTIYIHAQLGACTDESDFVVTVNVTPVIVTPGDQVACDSYTLPALSLGNYYDQPNGAGNLITAGTVLTTSQTVYVYAQTGTAPFICSDADSFTVTINASPVVDAQVPVNVCSPYTLPALTVGNYYTAQNGGGSQVAAGTVISIDTTLYVYAANGTCSDEETLVINIGTTPEFTIEGGCDGSNYVLTVIPQNASFDPATASYAWSASNGGSIQGFTDGQSAIGLTDGDYEVMVTSGPCSDTHSFTPDSVACDIQKGISPNGDGSNDCFDLTGQNVVHLEIFNRYGMGVFSSNNYTDQWCGQSDKGEDLPDGTYYYVIKRAAGDPETGWIYISRKQN